MGMNRTVRWGMGCGVWNCKRKSAALTEDAAEAERAAVLLDRRARYSQTNSAPSVLTRPMQTLKDPKNSVVILGFYADSVVSDMDCPRGAVILRR